ncbi:transcription antitermination factor NusB [Flavihumibacter solisilvae]|jgi:N utilization substance protein B|uniref:Antitermination protein NusB n=1 Tax=Flavihumibacter solisilvae TaxID=1349421 RepID=A0A0C1IJC6_9BACT|nr:transcription antitermination factor NusB [Flavihumibacter solisilvae]KIC94300.1 antitermination protein NusB [Flavihumibacter solisilvae]
MISRRNIRVKVMQTLYALDSIDQAAKPGEPVKLLQKQFDHTRQLLVYMIHFLTELMRYAETDARNRASKHLPTAADLEVNTKIAGNTLLWKVLEDQSYTIALNNDNADRFLDKELVRKLYLELVETPEYQSYISRQSREPKDEKAIVDYIYSNLMITNEKFTSHLEEQFNNWDDDCEMVNLLVQNYLNKPGSYQFSKILSDEKWQFAKNLLQTVMEKNEVTLDMIKPKLKNWDPERIATLDMILMQMGVCEFLYFETIPPKVTINEYIDLAKEYSTNQSGQFVNGILDNIHKDLVRDDKLHKVSFRK